MMAMQQHAHTRRGLTFNEMLVVLAVFMLLAVFFLLSSQNAMIKARTSRVLMDQRHLVEALSSYELDNTTLPTDEKGLQRLLGPVPYISALPSDPFQYSDHHKYIYIPKVSPKVAGLVISVGPDGQANLHNAIERERAKKGSRTGSASLLGNWVMSDSRIGDLIKEHTYDPTNGSVSPGDIITIYYH